ncbi:MAG: Hpt domain-containing protein [Desulfobacterales bacterium]|nr:Hpt domain-containing protein [Desulfobacterales bacterium]
MDLSKYEEIFHRESGRYLSELEDLLIRLKVTPEESGLWAEVHGKVHSIKGMARALSLEQISVLCHRVENWCKEFQSGTGGEAGHNLDTVEEAVDLLKLLVARRGEVESADTRQWYSRVTELLEAGPATTAGSEGKAQKGSLPRAVAVKPIDEVRVKYTLIEELLGLGQEIQMLEKNRPSLPHDETMVEVQNWTDQAMALMKNFFFRLSQLRLMPVEDFMSMFTHALHRFSTDSGKKAKMDIVGGDVQADVTLLERLREPFLHLLRNCIAHGIEGPEERRAAGKPEEGSICVEAAAFKERLHLKISDDGRGIDPEPIRRFLKDKRKMDEQEIAGLTEEDLFRTISRPDYTTMKEATDIAGRGVGMSVVSQAIEHLGGKLNIRSEPGKGTTFDIFLPLSLSIIHAITFRSGPFTFSVPTSEVASIKRAGEMVQENGKGVVDLAGFIARTKIPAMPGSHIIELKTDAMKAEGGNAPTGILAGGIVGNRPLMVMPITEPLSKVGLYSGIGIQENGDVSLVLDVGQLWRCQVPENG